MTAANTAELRGRYARRLTERLPEHDDRLRAAFAAVPREAFVGPPPWTIFAAGAAASATSDPADLYQDVLVELDAAKALNNGSPSLHAAMLHRLGVRPGERVLHVGAGTGYYTALLAELTGQDGQVTAVEYDARLAALATENLRRWPWVRVIHGDGAAFPTETTHRIYVNFALADPAEAWLDHLAVAGRLIFPLGTADPRDIRTGPRRSSRAAMLEVTRTPDGYAARFIGKVAFICAEGATFGDLATQQALFDAFGHDRLDRVTTLQRGPAPAGTAWVSTPRWSLTMGPAAA